MNYVNLTRLRSTILFPLEALLSNYFCLLFYYQKLSQNSTIKILTHITLRKNIESYKNSCYNSMCLRNAQKSVIFMYLKVSSKMKFITTLKISLGITSHCNHVLIAVSNVHIKDYFLRKPRKNWLKYSYYISIKRFMKNRSFSI